MTHVQGQASAEYAGLLGIAAVLGAALALVAGPPLAGAVRNAFVAALSRSASAATPVVTSAADIADVESALLAGPDARTPDAALVALGRRHGAEEAGEVAAALVLSAARGTTPWLGASRTYRAWSGPDDGPFQPAGSSTGDRDVEQPTGAPVVVWTTVAAQRRAVAAALDRHPNALGLVLDAVALIPAGGLVRVAVRAGALPFERVALTSARDAIEATRLSVEAVHVVESDDGDLAPGMRAGDVLVAWPVHRTAWRNGGSDPAPRIDSNGFGSVRLIQDYVHLVYLRPGAHGLAVIAQGFGT
jgi:hypothetical protein